MGRRFDLKDSLDLNPTGEKYTPPKAVRLRDSAVAVGANCTDGSIAEGHCSNGPHAHDHLCSMGGNVPPPP